MASVWNIFQDWQANRGNPKGKLVMLLFRVAHLLRQSPITFQALVINDGTVFGANCTVRNSTTIGNKRLKDGSYSRAPRFGDRVDIGANAIIIGPITIGHDVQVGAGAVVLKDVPSNSIVVGNPGRVIPRG
jgi:serine acetyltransferase